MAIYEPPNNNSVPFRFTKSGYVAPTNPEFDFTIPSTSTTANLRSMINVMGLYQDSTYTYIKRCPKYVVGYSANGVQIIQGPCEYAGIRDLGASLEGVPSTIILDLGGYIIPVISTYRDLSSYIGTHQPSNLSGIIRGWVSTQDDLPGNIHGWEERNLQAIIDEHQPSNIQAYLNTMMRSSTDMLANVYGWQTLNLSAYLNIIYEKLLGASLNPIPGVDLSAYLKVYPQRILPAYVHGWDDLNLLAQIQIFQKRDLNASIGMHLWRNLTVSLKGWAVEVIDNLPASIRGFTYSSLPAYIRAKYLKNLSAYLNPVPPSDLRADIYGWHALNLPAILNGIRYKYDLSAYINPFGGIRELSGYVRGVISSQEVINIRSIIHSWEIRNLGSYINSIRPSILSATINVVGTSVDLPAVIYPRMIRLTSILSLSTMEHLDLSATINSACSSSMFVNLRGYINTVFKSDLYASIRGVKLVEFYSSVGAKVGYATDVTHVDKLPISINIYRSHYRAEDKLPIFLSLFRAASSFSASIFGEYVNQDLSASIDGQELDPYSFKNPMNRELVYKLSPRNVVEHFKIVELSFRSIVKDYFYFSSGDISYKTDRFDKWVLDVKSYYPENLKTETTRKLHRTAVIGDLSRFSTMDEAIKYAIAFVTDDLQKNLSASITSIGRTYNLSASLRCVYNKPGEELLACSITPVGNRVIVGLEDGVEVL
jgi:hypothetical protein